LFLYETLKPIKLSKETLRFFGMRRVGPTFGVKKNTFSKCIGKMDENGTVEVMTSNMVGFLLQKQ